MSATRGGDRDDKREHVEHILNRAEPARAGAHQIESDVLALVLPEEPGVVPTVRTLLLDPAKIGGLAWGTVSSWT